MMKTTKELFELYTSNSGKKTFLDKQHIVDKKSDNNGNGDEVFSASKVKYSERFPEHGYDPGDDEQAYLKNNKFKSSQSTSTYTQKLERANEEVDQVDELSKNTIKSYFNKSLDSGVKSTNLALKADNINDVKKANFNSQKRSKGLQLAKFKLDEESNISEDHYVKCKKTGKVGKIVSTSSDGSSMDVKWNDGSKSSHDSDDLVKYKSKSLQESRSVGDGYWVQNHMGKLTHERPFRDSKEAIRHADKRENITGRVHTVTHVKDNKIHSQWQYNGGHNPGHWEMYKDNRSEPFYHREHDLSIKEESQIDEVSSYAKKKGYENIRWGHEYTDYDGSRVTGPETNIVPFKSDPKALKHFGFDYDGKQVGNKNDFQDPRKAKRVINRDMKGKTLTKEDVINNAINTYIIDKVTPIDEQLCESIESLSENTQMAIIELFNSLNEENQSMLVQTLKEGYINEVLDFALENIRGE